MIRCTSTVWIANRPVKQDYHAKRSEAERYRMIKLIASDMDGTLLDQNGNIPDGTFELIDRLSEHDIKFVVASGRSRYDLLELYGDRLHSADFVSSSGAQVYMNGKLAQQKAFSHHAMYKLKHAVDMFGVLSVILYDTDSEYILDDELASEYALDDDSIAIDTPFVQAAIKCEENPFDIAYALASETGCFDFSYSQPPWLDAMEKGINKVTGIRYIMDAYGIEPHEVMAFGDAINDYEMLKMAGIGNAMGNSCYVIKQIADKVIGSNSEYSVQKELAALLDAIDKRD